MKKEPTSPLPKLNPKEKEVVDAYVEEFYKRFEGQIDRMVKENTKLKIDNEKLRSKLVRRGLSE